VSGGGRGCTRRGVPLCHCVRVRVAHRRVSVRIFGCLPVLTILVVPRDAPPLMMILITV
jgi:hypothetical protein